MTARPSRPLNATTRLTAIPARSATPTETQSGGYSRVYYWVPTTCCDRCGSLGACASTAASARVDACGCQLVYGLVLHPTWPLAALVARRNAKSPNTGLTCADCRQARPARLPGLAAPLGGRADLRLDQQAPPHHPRLPHAHPMLRRGGGRFQKQQLRPRITWPSGSRRGARHGWGSPRRCSTPRWPSCVPASADMPGVHRLARPVAREREKATCGPHEKLPLCFR